MTKNEIQKHVQDIIEALYVIQDRIKEGIPCEFFSSETTAAQIDEQYWLVRVKNRFEIRKKRDGHAITFVYDYLPYTDIIGLLIKRFLGILDS